MTAVEGDGLRVRRAEPEDVDFLLELTTHEDVEPYLAGSRPRDRDGLLEEIERSRREPGEFGRFVVEVAGPDAIGWRRAGAVGFELANRRSRIANLGNLAVHPDFRGRRLADAAARLLQRHLLFELGFHRLQLEIYGFNERAQHHAERAGFVREGVRRNAYWRHDEWVDGVLYGLVREDLDGGEADRGAGGTAAGGRTSAASRWAEGFERAWRSGDGEAAAALYAGDCVFRSHPFRDLEDAPAYMRAVVPEAEAREVWFGVPFEDGDRAAIEYWALLIDPDGAGSTIAGCHLVRFGADGLVVEARDYWQVEPGHRRPPPEWGR